MICEHPGHAVTPERFREMRHEMGHTQAQIALWFGVSPLCVLRWERRQTALPGAAAILMHLLYEEHRGNPHPVRDYVKRVLGAESASAHD